MSTSDTLTVIRNTVRSSSGTSELDSISADDLLFANHALAVLAETVAEQHPEIAMGFGCAQKLIASMIMERMDSIADPQTSETAETHP